MKKIKVKSWKGIGPDGKEATETTVTVINYITHMGQQAEKLMGFTAMRKMNRIGVQLDKAQKMSYIVLHENVKLDNTIG